MLVFYLDDDYSRPHLLGHGRDYVRRCRARSGQASTVLPESLDRSEGTCLAYRVWFCSVAWPLLGGCDGPASTESNSPHHGLQVSQSTMLAAAAVTGCAAGVAALWFTQRVKGAPHRREGGTGTGKCLGAVGRVFFALAILSVVARLLLLYVEAPFIHLGTLRAVVAPAYTHVIVCALLLDALAVQGISVYLATVVAGSLFAWHPEEPQRRFTIQVERWLLALAFSLMGSVAYIAAFVLLSQTLGIGSSWALF